MTRIMIAVGMAITMFGCSFRHANAQSFDRLVWQDDFSGDSLGYSKWESSCGEYPAPFDQPFHLLMNVAVGGGFLGPPDATAP
ncbi:hypothetical protein [Rhodopirellula europaea]|uniref:hypothetical protein n=1 Tax=Rhodopirellula europaea TaxID=1263866 RepID=UPI003D2D03DD